MEKNQDRLIHIRNRNSKCEVLENLEFYPNYKFYLGFAICVKNIGFKHSYQSNKNYFSNSH